MAHPDVHKGPRAGMVVVRRTLGDLGLPMQTTVSVVGSEEVSRLLREFPVKGRKSIAQALNEAARWGRTQTARVIAVNMGVKKKDLMAKGAQARYGGVAVFPYAKETSLAAGFTILGRRIPLLRFGARPSTVIRPQPKGGISYKIGKEGRKRIRDAFVARGRRGRIGTVATAGTSGHLGVFRRGPNRKIFQLFGPSIPYVAGKDPAFASLLRTDLTPYLEKRVRHHLERLWDQVGYVPSDKPLSEEDRL